MKKFLIRFICSVILIGSITFNAHAAECSATISSNQVIGCTVPAGGVTINSGVSVSSGANIAAIYSQSGSIGAINNYGNLTGSGVKYGIYVAESSLNGGINNFASGIIRGDNNAIWITAGNLSIASIFNGGIYNAGQILDTGWAGIDITSTTFNGGITNTSTGKINGSLWGIGLFNYYYNNSVLNGGINNSGEISGNAADGIALTRDDSNYSTVINGGITNNATGTIFSYAGGNGINVNNAASSIDFITNYGSIYGATGTYFGINNAGYIGTLNNAQGAAGALTYRGELPSNYNIIINSASDFGKIAFTAPSSTTTTFGIYAGSTVAAGRYASVITGLSAGSFIGARLGTYGAYNWVLDNVSTDIWDLIFSSGGSSGPSSSDTRASMQYQASPLRSAFNSQTVAANFALNYDCNLFDVKGLCISAGGRYTAIDNPTTNASAAVVTLGYKVNQNIRIGGFMDQNINIHTPGSINVANKNPLMGLYAVWNKEASGLGYQVRLANTYQDKDVTATRIAYGDTGEAGSGTAKLNSQSYLAELSYAFQYQDKTLVRPYFGLRYTRLKRDGYTESSGADYALTYDALNDRSTTALIGARVNYQATPKTTFTANLGIEQDLHHKVDNMIATNTDIGELTPIAFNSNIKRTRPLASAGVSYDVTKAQRLSGAVTYQQLPFQATGAASLYVNYMIGF